MGLAGRHCVKANFDRELLANQLANILEAMRVREK
jgi:hypothetical protein